MRCAHTLASLKGFACTLSRTLARYQARPRSRFRHCLGHVPATGGVQSRRAQRARDNVHAAAQGTLRSGPGWRYRRGAVQRHTEGVYPPPTCSSPSRTLPQYKRGHVTLQRCGHVAVQRCGHVALQRCGHVTVQRRSRHSLWMLIHLWK
eukprot:3650768-Rhodomonas_salina.1